MYFCAWTPQDVLFEPETFKVQSRHFNLIAFSLELALLLKVLRSAGANAADSLEARLTQKPVVVPGEAEPQSKPFLSFACRVRSWVGAVLMFETAFNMLTLLWYLLLQHRDAHSIRHKRQCSSCAIRQTGLVHMCACTCSKSLG